MTHLLVSIQVHPPEPLADFSWLYMAWGTRVFYRIEGKNDRHSFVIRVRRGVFIVAYFVWWLCPLPSEERSQEDYCAISTHARGFDGPVMYRRRQSRPSGMDGKADVTSCDCHPQHKVCVLCSENSVL